MTIPQKEFYYLRHGQTDHNLNQVRTDHHALIPLNETGRIQAASIEPLIAALPIRSICYSPMARAVETKEIIASRLLAPQFVVPDLSECNAAVWQEMSLVPRQRLIGCSEPVQDFLRQVLNGFQTALAYEGPVLIVAHGGVHWALSSVLDIPGYDWKTDNCSPTHFKFEFGKWTANKLK